MASHQFSFMILFPIFIGIRHSAAFCFQAVVFVFCLLWLFFYSLGFVSVSSYGWASELPLSLLSSRFPTNIDRSNSSDIYPYAEREMCPSSTCTLMVNGELYTVLCAHPFCNSLCFPILFSPIFLWRTFTHSIQYTLSHISRWLSAKLYKNVNYFRTDSWMSTFNKWKQNINVRIFFCSDFLGLTLVTLSSIVIKMKNGQSRVKEVETVERVEERWTWTESIEKELNENRFIAPLACV